MPKTLRAENSTQAQITTKLAFYLPNLSGGGTERCILALAGDFVRRGYAVDLVLDQSKGAYLDQIPSGVRLVTLQRGPRFLARLLVLRAFPHHFRHVLLPVLLARKPVKNLSYVAPLAEYLRRERPYGMVAGLYYTNLVAIWARQLAKVPTRLIVSEQNNLSKSISDSIKIVGKVWRAKYIANVIQHCYPHADCIASVSNGVSDDLALTCNLERSSITTIYSPVVSKKLFEQASEPVEHPWFESGAAPVILAIGRLETQKDFNSLLNAFAILRKNKTARLLILGEGPLLNPLQDQAKELGIENDVGFAGWTDNPYKFMRAAAMFVCSSQWEGLPTVIIEAMACGCPIVSTDCPNGPFEILEGGRYGSLVPPADSPALAAAMQSMLESPPDTTAATNRAKRFTVKASADAYLQLLFNSHAAAPHLATQSAQQKLTSADS